MKGRAGERKKGIVVKRQNTKNCVMIMKSMKSTKSMKSQESVHHRF